MAKAKTKTQKIKTLLAQGKSVAEIVNITKASPSMVYAIRAKENSSASTITFHKMAGLPALKATRNPAPTTATVSETGIKQYRPPVRLTWWQKVKRFFGA
jgi:hypothetical protein